MADNKTTEAFVPPAARTLPEGALDSATAGASMLDAMAATDYGRNLLAHALVHLRRDGWLRDGAESALHALSHDERVRLAALDMAIAACEHGALEFDTIARAEEFRKFLAGAEA
jgi:hypothetical protein